MTNPKQTEPTDAMIEAAAKAMKDARLDSGEGTFHNLFDLLDCSGENKSHIFTWQLAKAALTDFFAQNAKKSERVEALEALAKRVKTMRGGGDNSLDVLIEVALFQAGTYFKAIRPNNAGTKVIFTDAMGSDMTRRADDWTIESRRLATLNALRTAAIKARGDG